MRPQRAQQRAFNQKLFGKQIGVAPALTLAAHLGAAQGEHLARVVPLVNRVRCVQPLVALQANQLAPQPGGKHPGHFGFADAGLTLKKKRA